MRIAYIVNQYPKVSHSFIRREIVALERQGFEVLRIALRGWDEELADAGDRAERERTRYVLEGGVTPLLIDAALAFVRAPSRFLAALRLAVRMGWNAARPLHVHLAYLAEACRVLPWLQSFGALHVHAHFGTNAAEVAMLAHALGAPAYSFTVHGPEEFDQPLALGLGEKARRAAFVVAISDFGRSQLYRWVAHAHWRKVSVVHCGLDAAFHDAAPVAPPESPRLVCVGRLCEQKGQLLLIEAAARLAAQGTRFELVLVGDGEMRGEIEALIAAHGLGDRIRITGWASGDAVRAEILAARALVLPSFAEGLPVVIMEAMALRRPVLATYVAGIPELVVHGKTGWLFPAGDIDALVLAMEGLLTHSLAELGVMGDAARARALARHAIDASAARLGRLFRNAVPALAGGSVR